ncbi:putative nucleic acid-binding, replication factor A [Helianthus anomalus]
MPFIGIAAIRPHDNAEPLQIRVIRKWIPFGKRQELCYLFVDINGDAIEAIADLNHQSHFESCITLESCYTITDYLSDTARSYMNVVPHTTCIRLGLRTSFREIDDNAIPHYYFNFVNYDRLRPRINNNLLLTESILYTDYIGRLVKAPPIFYRAGKNIMKISLQDQRKNLGSTNATTIVINPDIEDLENKTKFTCLASIKEIDSSHKWFYKSCTECRKKVLPKEEKFACPDHGEIQSPRFMYAINATIVDDTSSVSVVLFNDVVTSLLGIDCHDIVVKEDFSSPYILPTPLRAIRGKPKIFQLLYREQDNKEKMSFTVNKVFEPKSSNNDIASTSSGPTTKYKKDNRNDHWVRITLSFCLTSLHKILFEF